MGHFASITCERDTSRLGGSERGQRAKTSRHIAKAHEYPLPPFSARAYLGDNGECKVLQINSDKKKYLKDLKSFLKFA